MINNTKIFKKLIEERETKLEEKANGESWAELFNYPENRFWYTENISPLDDKIVNVANGIIIKFSIPCEKVEDIRDVYNNDWLMRLTEEKENKITPKKR